MSSCVVDIDVTSAVVISLTVVLGANAVVPSSVVVFCVVVRAEVTV